MRNGLSSQSVNLETPEEAPVRYDRAKKRRDDFHEEVEIDPTYQKKKKRKLVILVASASLAILVIAFSAYHFTHVTCQILLEKYN